MSGPEVGDRVRVHGEPFRGQYGHVADPTLVASAYLWDLWVTLDGDTGPHGFDLNEVEKVPTTPDDSPQSDEQGADVGLDPDAGVPITECEVCGQRHPVTRAHCSRCRSWSAFQRSGLCLICSEIVAAQRDSSGSGEAIRTPVRYNLGVDNESAPEALERSEGLATSAQPSDTTGGSAA